MTQNRTSLFDLSDRVALVAGGAGYLGIPMCRALLDHGAMVVVADLNSDRVQDAGAAFQAEIDAGRCRVCQFDIADEQVIQGTLKQIKQDFGRLDIAVNGTYRSTAKPMEELLAADFDAANRVNLTGSFIFARAAAEMMVDGGSIIHFASMYGRVSPDARVYEEPMAPNPIDYGAGKGGVIQMTRYLAMHYGPRGIRVNAIAPGPFPPPSVAEQDAGFVERLADRTMLLRVGDAPEVAGAVVFLASDASTYVTGEILAVDGGWTAW